MRCGSGTRPNAGTTILNNPRALRGAGFDAGGARPKITSSHDDSDRTRHLKVLVWQWGRYGAGPLYALELTRAFSAHDDVDAQLSLSRGAELLQNGDVTECTLPVRTYASLAGFAGRVASTPATILWLARRLRRLKIDIAVCAMPAAMDFAMAAALKLAGIPYAIVVHEADPHPGDRFPSQIMLQRLLARGAVATFALSSFVADRLREQDPSGSRLLLRTSLPPFYRAATAAAPGGGGGTLRVLSFGRLLSYKGLDLLTESLVLLGSRPDLLVRIVGLGPESAELDRLRALPGVTVENGWVPERDVGGVLGWADALILPYREASQSGVAAAAIAANRWIISTRVGGLPEQLADYPRAIMCDPDAADLAGAIRTLLERGDAPAPTVGDQPASWAAVASAMLEDLRRSIAAANATAPTEGARLGTPI